MLLSITVQREITRISSILTEILSSRPTLVISNSNNITILARWITQGKLGKKVLFKKAPIRFFTRVHLNTSVSKSSPSSCTSSRIRAIAFTRRKRETWSLNIPLDLGSIIYWIMRRQSLSQSLTQNWSLWSRACTSTTQSTAMVFTRPSTHRWLHPHKKVRNTRKWKIITFCSRNQLSSLRLSMTITELCLQLRRINRSSSKRTWSWI